MESTQINRLSRFNIMCYLMRVRVMCSHCGWQKWFEGGNAIDMVEPMFDHLKGCE